MESTAVSHTLSVAIRDYWRQQRRGYGTDENADQSRRLGAILNKNETPAMKEREDGAAAADTSRDTPIVHSLQRKESDHVIDVESHITDEEISKRIQCIMDSISHFHNDSSIQRGEEEISSNPNENLNLNPSQKQVVSSIESLWKKNNTDDNFNRNNMAAVLSGDYGTGKTVCACTLLWKRFIREKNGTQVVLCPIDSLVSLFSVVSDVCIVSTQFF
jgi:DNA replication protein DnaC